MKGVNNVLGLISGILIFIIGCISVFEVFMRGVLDQATVWSLDISQYIMIWSLFLGTAYSLQQKGHVAVDFVREYTRKKGWLRLSRSLAVVSYLMSLSVVAVLLWSGIKLSMQALEFNKLTAQFIQIPQIYLTVAIVLGAFLMMLTTLFILLDLLRGGEEYL